MTPSELCKLYEDEVQQRKYFDYWVGLTSAQCDDLIIRGVSDIKVFVVCPYCRRTIYWLCRLKINCRKICCEHCGEWIRIAIHGCPCPILQLTCLELPCKTEDHVLKGYDE